ncbi:UNVERIFIED_CONTAM: hypothetical protein Sindi_1819600 [Sesamum indicum]
MGGRIERVPSRRTSEKRHPSNRKMAIACRWIIHDSRQWYRHSHHFTQGKDLEFTVKFGFRASNNEAEYEALIMGLRMMHEVGTRHLIAYSDSWLIVKQVEGSYEDKEEIRSNIYNR